MGGIMADAELTIFMTIPAFDQKVHNPSVFGDWEVLSLRAEECKFWGIFIRFFLYLFFQFWFYYTVWNLLRFWTCEFCPLFKCCSRNIVSLLPEPSTVDILISEKSNLLKLRMSNKNDIFFFFIFELCIWVFRFTNRYFSYRLFFLLSIFHIFSVVYMWIK